MVSTKIKKVNCPRCDGSGKTSITVSYAFSDKPDETNEIDCIDCDGKGKVTHEEADHIRNLYDYADKMWCKCKNHDPNDVKYWGDGKGKWVTKHHWTCTKCGKVTQIG